MERRINIDISDVIYQLQEIDYSLLLDIIKPIIVYYIADKSIKTYKLHKEFNAKVVSPIELPPDILKRNEKVDKKRLLQQDFSDSIINFATTMIVEIPNKDLNLFYNNLSNLTTRTKSFKISNLLLKSNTQGSYKPKSNKIMLQENNYTLTIDHELFHMASTFYRESDGMIFSGFMQETKDKKCIANGINEGYTQLLAERYFGENKVIMKAYQYEKSIMEKLEMIIGKEKMQSLYFNANLYGLIQELKQYEDENTIMQFITDIDFLNVHLRENHWLLAKKNMIISKLKNANEFLLSCYLKKLIIESIELEEELLRNKLKTFLTMMWTSVRIGKTKCVFMDKDEIVITMNKILESFQDKENNVEEQDQQSALRVK